MANNDDETPKTAATVTAKMQPPPMIALGQGQGDGSGGSGTAQEQQQPLTPEQQREAEDIAQQRKFIQDLYEQMKIDVEDAQHHATRFNDNLRGEVTPEEAAGRMKLMNQLSDDIRKTSKTLRLMLSEPSHKQKVQEVLENHFATHCIAVGRYEKIVAASSSPTFGANQTMDTMSSHNMQTNKLTVKLPEFKLKDFDGSIDNWITWKDAFTSIIHSNEGISKAMKFHYLRSSVKLPAGQKSVLDNFPMGESYYDEAWSALCKRYDDPKKTKTHLFQKLMNVKTMSGESLSEMTRIIDEFSSIVTSLDLCGATYDDLLVHIVQYRLDDVTKREWQREMKHDDDVTFSKLMKFLTCNCNLVSSLSSNSNKRSFTKPSEKSQSTSKAFAAAGSSSGCAMCRESHPLFLCPKFKLLNVSGRYRVVNDSKLCHNCFSPQHIRRNCTSAHRCKICSQQHHSMLHNEGTSNPGAGSTENKPMKPSNPPQSTPEPSIPQFRPPTPPRVSYDQRSNLSTTHTFTSESQPKFEALLSTVSFFLLDANNTWKVRRALLDSGSQGNHITTSCAKELGIPLVPSSQTIIGINGQTSMVRHTATVQFSSRYRKFSGTVDCFVSDDITGMLPNRRVDVSKLEIPKDLFLADPMFHEPGKIDMLLGTGIFHDAQLNNVIKRPGVPVLIETEFGWTVGGQFPVPSPSSTFTCCFTQHPTSGIESLDEKLERFLDLENDGMMRKKILSPEQQHCVKLYDETTVHDEETKEVTVVLPEKEGIDELDSNFENALRQFFYQESKRLNNPAFNKAYIEYMDWLMTSGRMSEVAAYMKREGFYLPHHGVIKITSRTTKVRPVYNGSSKSKNGNSLNDCLCVGPIVQPDLLDILLRFREGRYVAKGDVEKMYLQVKVHESQRKFQKILWRNSPDEPIRHFTIDVVTFGLAPSAFLATNTLIFAANKYADRFPKAADAIKKCIYVDDFVCSFDNLEEGMRTLLQVRHVLAQVNFPLRKFSSNHPEMLKILPPKDLESTDDEEAPLMKTLGISWNSRTDCISFPDKDLGKMPTTKAELLSEIAGFFDPLGLISPVIVIAKFHMKMVRKLKWNDNLPTNVTESWKEFRSTLPALKDLSIPRHAITNNPVAVSLHGFSDASQEAYGAAFYLRSTDAVGNVQVTLLCSKSRVSPPKQQTIARLELCAATLMSTQLPKVLGALTTTVVEVILWSDSMIVLFWILEEPSKQSVFVGNRTSVVQENTSMHVWRHASSNDMPADKLSRGVSPDEIQRCDIWWNGPSFLRLPPSEWPKTKLEINGKDKEEHQKELRKTFVVIPANSLLTLIESRFSTLTKLINCFAYIRRLAADKKHSRNILSLDEIKNATENIVRILQLVFFPAEYGYFLRKIENPSSSETLNSNSPLRQLHPFMNEMRIICVGGRIQESPGLTMQQKHPMILPNCFFAKLIIRDLHKKCLHPGNQAMLSYVRENYWPLGAKQMIKQVKRECLTCFRAQPKLAEQLMGNLPLDRVRMSPPFVATAVDYAGSFDLRTSLTKKSSITKVYIAVFKCMATGAIHLEPVTSLSTPAFIATFDRFISRRGLASDMYSDNGTNFVGANNEFMKILKEIEPDIAEHLKEKSINWHFTTPLAPHAGGYYESGVKTMKQHLVRECANRSFDYEQFTTLLCKIEAVVNSRPLMPLSDDVNDMQVLTPAHFLIGRSLIAKPERNFLPANTNRLDRYNQLQQLQQKFWNLWYHDYLHHLQTRPSKFRQKNEFHVGDLVLLKDANLPPLKWIMGRVIKLFPDKEGNVRNALIKTPTGEKHRHVKYLAFLPPPESSRAGENVRATKM